MQSRRSTQIENKDKQQKLLSDGCPGSIGRRVRQVMGGSFGAISSEWEN